MINHTSMWSHMLSHTNPDGPRLFFFVRPEVQIVRPALNIECDIWIPLLLSSISVIDHDFHDVNICPSDTDPLRTWLLISEGLEGKVLFPGPEGHGGLTWLPLLISKLIVVDEAARRPFRWVTHYYSYVFIVNFRRLLRGHYIFLHFIFFWLSNIFQLIIIRHHNILA